MRKTLIFVVRLALVLLTSLVLVNTTGCGGGGKDNPVNPPINPPPNNGSNNQVKGNITANPNRLYSEEETILSITVEGPGPVNIDFRQEPQTPQGRFTKIDNNTAKWKAPIVDKETNFKVIASITFPIGITIDVYTQVTVLPKSPPPVNPPKINIYYPWEDGKVNVVGEGVILTVKGNVSSESGFVSVVECVVDGEVVSRTTPSPDGYFELDVTRFGNIKGNKQLEIRATTTDNITGTYKINIIYDDNLLYNLAIEFLRKYSSINGRLVRYGDLNDGPYNKPVRVWINEVQEYKPLIEQACNFWTKYTGIQFQLLTTDSANTPYIIISKEFDKDPGYAADTLITGQTFKVNGIIRLYKGWEVYDPDKALTIAHEIGHVLMTIPGKGHTDEGDIMDGRSPTWLLHTYQQLAMKIKYNKNPGDNL